MSQNFYFEPPSRIQLVDKMAHLLRYSDFLIVIVGPKGSGKSAVAQRLALITQTSDLCQIVVSLESETGALSLALQCAKLITDEYVDGMDPLTILHEKSRALHDVGQSLLILIDNAEWLNDEAIELLAGLLVSGVGKPKVVLAGEDTLVNRLSSLSLYELLEGRLHLENLQPFSEDESKEFLTLKFSSQQGLKLRDFKQVFEASSGYPGQLTSAASELYRSGKVVNRTSKLPLPLPHIAGIGIVLFGVLFISVWQVFQGDKENIEPQIVEGRVSVPLSVTLDTPLPEIKITPAVSEVQSELSKLLADQEQLLNQEPTLVSGSSTPTSLNTTISAPDLIDVVVAPPAPAEPPLEEADNVTLQVEKSLTSTKTPEATVAKAAIKVPLEEDVKSEVVILPAQIVQAVVSVAPKPIVKTKIETPLKKTDASLLSGASIWLKEDQLLAWPASGYTLQVLGARSEESIVQFMGSLKSPDRLYYFSTVYKNAPWHVVVYGQYANRTAANRAVNSLPLELKKLKPWARSISGVQQDIKKK